MLVARARARQSRRDLPEQTTHNDLNPWNILCATDGWRTLDWEWVGTNDPLFDLVTLGLGVQVDHPTLVEMARDYGDRASLATSTVADRLDHAIGGFCRCGPLSTSFMDCDRASGNRDSYVSETGGRESVNACRLCRL